VKIAAVFATMNRAAVAADCVVALSRQTRTPDLVVVADNRSTDLTAETLEALPSLPFTLIVHRMPENQGNAGGVNEACLLAFAKGADFVWILDDDSIPRPPALAALLEGSLPHDILRHTLQIDPKSGKFTWPMWISSPHGGKSLIDSLDKLPPGRWIPTLASWTGLLLSRDAWNRAGPIHSELFIRGEDEEYPWRLSLCGFRFEASRDSILDHPGPPRLIHWRIGSHHFFFEPELPSWKSYYKVRNMVWIKRRQGGPIRAMMIAIAYSLASVVYDGISSLPRILNAAMDGWNARLGRLKDGPPP
jgi:GT2 family glycosyltransferase